MEAEFFKEDTAIEKIKTITARELYGLKLPPLRFLVEGMLSRGVHIFAGPSKVGKSWLLLQLSLAVATGTPFLGCKTEEGTVLSLSLEDNYQRLQQRISELTDDPPEKLHLAICSETLTGGLCNQLTDFLEEHDDTVLVIVDTFQMVRDDLSDSNLYAKDYRDVSQFKKIAEDYEVGILLVQHLRKETANDPHAMISGSTGLVGAADGSFVLWKDKYGDEDAKLYVRGRDLPETQFTLRQDPNLGEWSLVSCDIQRQNSLEQEPMLRGVMEYIFQTHLFEGTATVLAETLKLDCPPNILSRKLGKYRSELQQYGIYFEPYRTGKERIIRLRERGWRDGMTVPSGGAA